MASKPAAYRDGWLAHLGGVSLDANPHNEATQPWSHLQWVSGWCQRFSAIKHGQWDNYMDEAIRDGED